VTKKIYVGNLPWSANDTSLGDLFGRHGEVISSRVVTDRDTGRSRGFGFVEMDGEDADSAIKALNGTNLDGRPLKVNEAEERTSRPPRQSW
jgi:RNA recognition motif-containing protein